MGHKKSGGGDHGGGDMGHGDRPWVYFMIDSFFLVTQFFVLTFKVRAGDDLILPHRLPPGGSGGTPNPDLIPKDMTQIAITVLRRSKADRPMYMINASDPVSQEGLAVNLTNAANLKTPDKYSVVISCEGKVVFEDVVPIFNTCVKLDIKECGLQNSKQ